MLMDGGICGDRNVVKEDAEKILKYKDLIIEFERIWNVKAKVISVIIGATGTISESLQTVPEQRTGKARNEGTAKKQPYWALHTYCGKC